MTEKSYPRLENGVVIYGPEQEKPKQGPRVEVKVDAKAAPRRQRKDEKG